MNKILIEEIKRQYPSLQKWNDNYAFELYKKIQEHQLITEFIYTVDPKKTTQQILKQAGYGVQINYTNNKITLTFDTLKKDYLDKVNKVMNNFGWYPAYIDNKDGGKYSSKISNFINKNEITIIYEAKYDQEIIPTSDYAYHLTPDIKWPKIKALGLTPKTQGKLGDHPGRIYLLTNIENLEDFGGDIDDISFALLSSYINKDKVTEMLLLKIDLKQLKKDHKFFEDPNFFMGDAVWTYQNIPPSAISIANKINVTY
jgi:hypothetical protein